MREQRCGSILRAGLLAGALVGFTAPMAFGQAVITGRVTSERGDPLAGASVLVIGTNLGASTTASGSYTLTVDAASARGQDVQLTARAVGYRPKSSPIKLTSGSQTVNYTLAPDPLHLEEIVVTGVAAATETNKLPFQVSRVSEAALQQAPSTTALGALQGKVAGLTVFSGNGMPGTAPQIKLRGSTSITGSQEPLIIIDGAITTLGSLADISSEDIERVEIVKGAAASSLYGSNGANGVIQVFTRRGAHLPEGKIQVTARGEFGYSKISRFPEVTQHHPYLLNADGSFYRKCQRTNGCGLATADSTRVENEVCSDALDGPKLPGGLCPAVTLPSTSVCPTANRRSDGACKVNIQDQLYPVYAHATEQVYDPGQFWTQYVSVGENRGRTNFNVSFQNTHNQGSVFNLKGQRRQNYRMNLDQVLSDKLDMSFNAFYGKNSNVEPSGGGDGGPFFSLAFLEPSVDPTACCNPDGTKYRAFIQDKRSNAANPLYDLFNVDRTRERNRFTGGTRARWRPFGWLTAEGSFNYDELSEEFISAGPLKYWSASNKTAFRPGGYFRQAINNRNFNTGGSLTGTWRLTGSGLTDNLGITIKGAYSYEDVVSHVLSASASEYIVAGVPEFPGTKPESQRASSTDIEERTKEGFGVGTLDFNGKVILDGLVRRDGSSLFGPDARYKTYWRASGAIRVPQLLGWKSPEELRLRASYGTAGLRPNFFAQYEVLQPSAGSFIKQQLGNRNLRPAQSGEFEIGGNLGLFNGRFTLEYNYSDKKTHDEIVLAPLLATTGFNSQWQNVGSLRAKTHEVSVGAQVINSRDASLQLNLVGDRVRETITDWPLPSQIFGTLDTWAGFVYQTGVRLGTMTGQKWARNINDLYLDPVKAAANGAGQAFDPAKYAINSDGYVVALATKGTADERPIAIVACSSSEGNPIACSGSAVPVNSFNLGVAAPDFRVGLNTTFSWKRFAIAGLLDWSHGGQITNGTAHWATQDCADIRCDQASKAPADRIAEGFYRTGLYNGAASNDGYIESASFVKLRELSVNYTFAHGEVSKIGLGRWLNEVRVGMIGRNLATWTKYRGVDPEVAPQADDAFKGRSDWFQYPPFRTITGFIEIAF
ncbi:MAG TPA: SusC/RagA family TonB-linked outer membrane protein [Gemmatimonadales bacterium]|nr:SusC/RagA family TonB-linked outer membrane protein [Gemmatimonadales bacterium]